MSEPIHPQIDPRVDAALADLPPATLPPALVKRTMAQIAREGAATAAGPRYRPRFDWWGLALPGLGIVLVAASVGLAVGSLNRLDPLWSARMGLSARLQWNGLLMQAPDIGSGLLALVIGAVMAIGLMGLMVWELGPALLGGQSPGPGSRNKRPLGGISDY